MVRKARRRVLEKLSLLEESAGRGAFLMDGYCNDVRQLITLFECSSGVFGISMAFSSLRSRLQVKNKLTVVVRTPYSSCGGTGLGAAGVSINSNSSDTSDPD